MCKALWISYYLTSRLVSSEVELKQIIDIATSVHTKNGKYYVHLDKIQLFMLKVEVKNYTSVGISMFLSDMDLNL